MSKQPSTRTYCERSRPLPYYHPNCRTPRDWKFTQHHRTTRPPLQELGYYAQGQGHNHVRGQIVPKIVLLINYSSKFDENSQKDKA